MNAINITGNPSGGDRKILKNILPIQTPLCVVIFPIYACNFKCIYCSFSIKDSNLRTEYGKDKMDMGLYCKCIDGMTSFEKKIKKLCFAGLGEPLLHNHIGDMVDYAVRKQVAESVEIVTNGSLLTPELSDKLIDANLSKLCISVQGTHSGAYKEVSDVDLDFNKFVENIKYFYMHKKNTHLFIKTVDYNLNIQDEFYNIFGDICDSISIEKIAPLSSQVDYSALLKPTQEKCTVRGLAVEESPICSFPFYMAQINPDGNVIPCCSGEHMPSMGNCEHEQFKDIWLGKEFNNFRIKILDARKDIDEKYHCKKCVSPDYVSFPEDRILIKDVDGLKKLFL